MRIKKLSIAVLIVLFSIFGITDSAKESFRSQFLNGEVSWEQVREEASKEGEVHFYYWGGDDNLNIWMDSIVKNDLLEQGIELVPHRITSTKDAIDLALAEKHAGKNLGEGSVDVIWVNGENFYTLAVQDLLFGDFAEKLPEAGNFEWSRSDQRSKLNHFDFGYPTLGREMPWSGEQFVCAANRTILSKKDTPHTFRELEQWLNTNKGLFTYVKPPHYLGNTFVQEVLYEFNPDNTGADPFQKSLSEFTAEEFARLIEPGMNYLRRIAPNLANSSGGSTKYPENEGALLNLFKNSEIAIECQFGLFHVATNKKLGKIPQATEEIILPESNMIKNKNYLVLVGNASNPAASLVFINYMSSFEAQKTKMDLVGYPVGLDVWTLNQDKQQDLALVTPPHFGITQQDLDDNIAPDTNSSLVNVIESVWLSYVERHSEKSVLELVTTAIDAQ